MASTPSINAVARAIDLLQALNRQPVSTIETLHRQTGVPKPSIIRLLQTFAAKGLVRHAPQYGAYYLTSAVNSLSCGYHSEPRVVEAAAPVADALTRDVKWPVAVAVFETDAMVVRYSTIPQSPLSLLHSTINMRLSVVSRALGRAFLAFCTPREQEAILEIVRRSSHPEDAPARDAAATRRMLAETRRRGYALRDPAVRPISSSIAVPVFDGRRVVASMCITWFTSALKTEEVVERYLPHLQRAAESISANLGKLGSDTHTTRPSRDARAPFPRGREGARRCRRPAS